MNKKEPKYNPSPYKDDRRTRKEADVINTYLQKLTQEFIDYLVASNSKPLNESVDPAIAQEECDNAIALKYYECSRKCIKFVHKKWKYNKAHPGSFETNVSTNIKTFNLTFKKPNENGNENISQGNSSELDENSKESSLRVVKE